ncbi:MAG: hypothetical protein JRM77_10025 [Nitrososphaerota archaeon]|nr:hypothetical protein [Nitrososphaerota archaeon]
MPIEGYRTVSVKENALEKLNRYASQNETSAPAIIASIADRLDARIKPEQYLQALEAAATAKIHAAINESVLRAELVEISRATLKLARYLDQIHGLTSLGLEAPLNRINGQVQKMLRIVVETHLEGLFFDDYKNLLKTDKEERKELDSLLMQKNRPMVVQWRIINLLVLSLEELNEDVEHFSRLFPEDEKIQMVVREIKPCMSDLAGAASQLKDKAELKRHGYITPPKGVLPTD